MMHAQKSIFASLCAAALSVFALAACSNIDEEDSSAPLSKEAQLDKPFGPEFAQAINTDGVIMDLDLLKSCGVLRPRGFKQVEAAEAPSGFALTGTVSLPNPAWEIVSHAQEKRGSVTVVLETSPPADDVQVIQVIADHELKTLLPGNGAPEKIALTCRKSK